MPTDQLNLEEYALQLPSLPDGDHSNAFTPLTGRRTRLSTYFSVTNRTPTYLKYVADIPGVVICTKCNPPVFYDDKMVAVNKDPHWDEEVWLKRLRPWNDSFVDPVILRHLTPDQQEAVLENGVRPAKTRD